MTDRTGSSPALLAAAYALGAAAWIVFSDRAVAALAPDLASFSHVGTLKGLAFVGVTTLLLWGILRGHRSRLEAEIASTRRSEASARAAEERLRLATSAANVGLWDWDVATDRVFYSPEWKRQIGFADDEISDELTEWRSRVHPDDLTGALQTVERNLQSGASQYDNLFRFRHRDGSYRWILAQAAVRRDPGGQPSRVLGSHIDITDRKRAEETLRRHEAALEMATEAANLGVWQHDLESGEVHCDERARAQCGFEESPSGLAAVLARVHPDDRERVGREFEALAAPEGPDRFATEYRVLAPDGEIRWVSVHLRVVVESDRDRRRPVRIFGTTQDITSRKRAEHALRDSEERLRQAQKMEAVGQLAGGVAHDFNNILVVIQGHADLMRLQGDLSPALSESCDEIAGAAERAAALTRQLLLFSRRQVMQLRDVDLNALVAETATLLRRVLGENIELQVRCSAAPLPLHADRGMIDLVLLNLAVNARDAMPEGGTLIVETVREERAGQALARLDVRDSGKGIPAEILPRIFEPFFTTKDVGKGTGLGLATVFGIVQEHGGTIEVDSQPGRGTAFRVFFPLSTRKPAADQGPRADGPRGGTETLLLAEDDPSVRSLMVGVLSRLGYRVLQATSGVEALEVARAHAGEIALVVTDLVMPGGISGLELGRRIAAAHPLTKVVYTSGFSTELAGTQIELKENVNFLPKPFSPWALARVVRERLDEDERLPGGSA